MEMLELKCHNHNDYPLLYKWVEWLAISSGRFLECRKCNISVATQVLVHCLICPHSPSGIVCTYQAMHSCLCYNYYMYVYMATLSYVSSYIQHVTKYSLRKLFDTLEMTYSIIQCIGMCLPVSEIVLTELIGHGPAMIVPCKDLGPTNVPLSFPPVVILYTTLQCNPSTTTVANPFIIGALPIARK